MLISTHEIVPGGELAKKVTDSDARMKSFPPAKCNATKHVIKLYRIEIEYFQDDFYFFQIMAYIMQIY